MDDHLRTLFERHTVVTRSGNPSIARRLRRSHERGDIVAVLPGVYAQDFMAQHFRTRALAVCAADPGAVLVGPTAALLTFASDDPEPAVVEAACRLAPRKGFRFTRRSIPAGLVEEDDGLRVTAAGLTVLDLCLVNGPSALDTALRHGVPLESVTEALEQLPHRRGNTRMWQLLQQARERPWSAAERAGHMALRDHHISGWQANLQVFIARGAAYLDIAFSDVLLAFEIDGYEYHGSKEAFISDRLRDADLASIGWEVIRIPASLVLNQPGEFVAIVRRILASRRAQFGAADAG